MPLLLVTSPVQPLGSSHVPPGRLSPLRALSGQGSYLHTLRLSHPVLGKPEARKEGAAQDRISRTSSLEQAPGRRPALPGRSWGEASPRTGSKQGGHWSPSPRIKHPTRASAPQALVPPECQVRPPAQPFGVRRPRTGPRLRRGDPAPGPRRTVPAPALPEGPGRGR